MYTFLYIEKKLNNLGTSIIDYLNHLSGNDYNENLASINYSDVVFELEEYHNVTTLLHDDFFDYDVEGDISGRLSFFHYGIFLKCYNIGIKKFNEYNITYANYDFNHDPFLHNFVRTRYIYVMVHGPRQMLLARNVQLISFKYNEMYSTIIEGKLIISKRSSIIVP